MSCLNPFVNIWKTVGGAYDGRIAHSTVELRPDEAIWDPMFEKCLEQFSRSPGTPVLVGKHKIPGTIAKVHFRGICTITVGNGAKSLILHPNDFDFDWGDEVTLGFLRRYENSGQLKEGSQHYSVATLSRAPSSSVYIYRHGVGDFCTGSVKRCYIKGQGYVQYLFVRKTNNPRLLHRNITFVRKQAILGLCPEVRWSALLAVKQYRTPTQTTIRSVRWAALGFLTAGATSFVFQRRPATKLPVLPVEIWHKIFWMAAIRFDDPINTIIGYPIEGHPVLLHGAFGEEDGFIASEV